MLILGGRHLVSVLAEFAEHYNVTVRIVPWGRCRHWGLANQLWSCRLGGSCAEIALVG